MTLSRRASAFLLGVAAWTWIIWPTFLRNIWRDERSFDGGPTSFLIVHAVLVAVSLAIGTALGVLGWRGWRGWRAGSRARDDPRRGWRKEGAATGPGVRLGPAARPRR